ncbi:hypothetical protein TNCV_4732641 [Trichonephila clavipes]|nr:hypothetical protein TNCV_4732641 [Trichonephila clavipes]
MKDIVKLQTKLATQVLERISLRSDARFCSINDFFDQCYFMLDHLGSSCSKPLTPPTDGTYKYHSRKSQGITIFTNTLRIYLAGIGEALPNAGSPKSVYS